MYELPGMWEPSDLSNGYADTANQVKPCEVHEMSWCAICNGDDKRQKEALENRRTFSGLLKETK